MNNTDYAYGVACVRVKERELLTKSFIEQLASEPDYEKVCKELKDKGAWNLDSKNDFLSVLNEYMERVWSFISDVAPDNKGFLFMIIRNDFHNLKAVIKNIILNNSGTDLCIKPSILDAEFLYNTLAEKDFDSLPLWISDVAKKSYEILTTTMDGQLFDMYIDKESLAAMKEFSGILSCDLAKDYTEKFIAVTNIKTAIRLSKHLNNESVLDNAFCICDTLDTEELKKAVSKGYDDVLTFIKLTDYDRLAVSISKSIEEFEKECDNILVEVLENARYISIGPEPLICFYYAKDIECKYIRTIIGGKIVGMPQQHILERLGSLYV